VPPEDEPPLEVLLEDDPPDDEPPEEDPLEDEPPLDVPPDGEAVAPPHATAMSRERPRAVRVGRTPRALHGVCR
jgi:hypothetical protein